MIRFTSPSKPEGDHLELLGAGNPATVWRTFRRTDDQVIILVPPNGGAGIVFVRDNSGPRIESLSAVRLMRGKYTLILESVPDITIGDHNHVPSKY